MNRKSQRGMTLAGWLIVLVIIGVFAIAAMRLVPLYLEYFRISSTLSSLEAEMISGGSSKKDIRTFLDKRFNIEAITRITAQDIKITARGDVWDVRAVYDAREPFIGNVHFIVTFDESVEIKR